MEVRGAIPPTPDFLTYRRAASGTYLLFEIVKEKKPRYHFAVLTFVSSCSYKMTAPVLKPKICFSTETMPQYNYKWRSRFLCSNAAQRELQEILCNCTYRSIYTFASAHRIIK